MSKTKDKLPKGIVLQAWIIVLGAIAPMLDSTMVNIAVNHLAADFHSGLSLVQWVITGYMLAMVVAVPFTGWLMDRVGGKRVFLVAEALFGIMSLAAAFAWNVDSLIFFRVLQGFSAGLITPLLTTMLVDVAGSASMGKIMAIVGLPILLGPIVGPVIGGLVIQVASWHWLFLINVPITMIAGWLIWTKLPQTAPKNRTAKFDWLGVLLLSATSASVIYGIVQASDKADLTNSTTIAYVVAGLILLGAYLWHARVSQHPVVPLNLFKRANFSASMLGLFLGGIVVNGPMLLLPLFFQNLRGESVAVAGLSLIPQGVGMLLARPLIGRLIDQIGARFVTLGGLIITIIGSVPFIYFDQNSAYWLIMVVLFIRGLGEGAILSPIMTDAFVGGRPEQSAQISIATRVMQNVGGAFGSAVLATVVVNFQSQHTQTLSHIATSYQQGFLWSVIFTAVMAIPALFLTSYLGKEKASA